MAFDAGKLSLGACSRQRTSGPPPGRRLTRALRGRLCTCSVWRCPRARTPSRCSSSRSSSCPTSPLWGLTAPRAPRPAPPRTNRTRRVPHPVLIGRAASNPRPAPRAPRPAPRAPRPAPRAPRPAPARRSQPPARPRPLSPGAAGTSSACSAAAPCPPACSMQPSSPPPLRCAAPAPPSAARIRARGAAGSLWTAGRAGRPFRPSGRRSTECVDVSSGMFPEMISASCFLK
jgi:hypothetical protein